MNTVRFTNAIIEVSLKEVNLIWLALSYYKDTVVPGYKCYDPQKACDVGLAEMLGQSIEQLNAECVESMQRKIKHMMEVLEDAEKYYPFEDSPSEMMKGAE